MNDILSKFIIFAAGVGVGSAVTWKIVKDKYEQITNEEIESFKEVHSRVEHERINHNEKPNIKEYAKAYAELVSNENYSIEDEIEKTDAKRTEKPYVIPPSELDEMDDYDVISLIYYSDGVLTDENNELVDDIEETVGLESLTRFGEYEKDSVCVRNDRLRCDYEILLDARNYYDLIGETPSEEE